MINRVNDTYHQLHFFINQKEFCRATTLGFVSLQGSIQLTTGNELRVNCCKNFLKTHRRIPKARIVHYVTTKQSASLRTSAIARICNHTLLASRVRYFSKRYYAYLLNKLVKKNTYIDIFSSF